MLAIWCSLCWSGHEEIPHVQGKRNPSKMVGTERGHQMADRLKSQSQTTSQSDHMDHSLSSSVKLSHAMSGHPRWMGHGLTKCGPLKKGVGSCVRHYWQNRGTALNPLPLFCRHRPGMKELGFVILTWFFLSSAELNEENIKVLIVFERSMRRHKAFCSCAWRIINS